jgi:CDK-activating kinase assembly factor MAT1
VFNLVNDIDVEKTEAKIAAYKAENAALIELNIQREEREILTAQEEEERDRQEREERAKEIRREEEIEREERTKQHQKILEQLARGGTAVDAKRLVEESRAAAAKRAAERAETQKAAFLWTMQSSKKTKETIPDPPHKPLADDWYAYEDKYVLRRDYDDAISEHVRGDMERLARAGGYNVEESWDRAIRYAVAGLETMPLVGLPS